MLIYTDNKNTCTNWQVNYFNEQVVKDITAWPVKMQAKYLRTVDLVEKYGPQLGEPFTKSLKNGLFELRIKAQEGTGRAFFCYQLPQEIVVLHAFVKKTQKTPRKELRIARERLREVVTCLV